MGVARYTDEFKAEAVKQIVERGYPVSKVFARIGVSPNSLYKWLKEDAQNPKSLKAERLNKELVAASTLG